MKQRKHFRILLFSLMIITLLFSSHAFAANTGFQKIGGKTYYVNADGSYKKGWLKTSSARYYFSMSSGQMVTGWAKLNNKIYYFGSNGKVYTGKKKVGDSYYYFAKPAGYRKTGWKKISGKQYYFASNGKMATGFWKISNDYYFFEKKTGVMKTGWISYTNGKKRFFRSSGKMATGKLKINGKTYTFDKNGYMTDAEDSDSVKPIASDGKKTIKNYLAQAMLPVGKALYVWGGGWNDANRKGISPTWVQWYNTQTSDYNFKSNGYNDLSVKNRANGLDCSGFVGWAAYQVMHEKTGEASGYTVVAADVGNSYVKRGWGSLITQDVLAATDYKLEPGDVGFNSGHTWIVVGQCPDKSVVIVHSTDNAGCQIAGTPTPDGGYNSQAQALAKKYMQRYSGYTKYTYNTSTGNYLKNGTYFRWSSSTLSDPDKLKKKTADQILAILFP